MQRKSLHKNWRTCSRTLQKPAESCKWRSVKYLFSCVMSFEMLVIARRSHRCEIERNRTNKLNSGRYQRGEF